MYFSKIAFAVFLWVSCSRGISAVPALQQTVPPGDVAVCPLSTVQYTCVAQNELQWKDNDLVDTVMYSVASKVNAIGMAGVFTTVLTDISGNTLTSTATIDSVNLTDDGRRIRCRDDTTNASSTNLLVQVADVPLDPSNLAVTNLNSITDSKLSVNLTWSPSRCVMVYYVEVTSTNINFTNTTTSQHITLTLQIGVEYSFRVRGADTINRLGQWSDPFVYTPMPLPSTSLPSPTAPPTNGSGQLSGGAIAGIVVGVIIVTVILVLIGIIILFCTKINKRKPQKARIVTEKDFKEMMEADKAAGRPDELNYVEIEQSGEVGKSGTKSTDVKKPDDNSKVLYSEVRTEDTTKQPHKQTQSVPKQSQSTPSNPTSKPKASPSNPKAPPSNPKAPPNKPKAPPSNPKAPPSNPKAPPSKPKAPPSNPKAPPSNPKAPPSNPKAPPNSSSSLLYHHF